MHHIAASDRTHSISKEIEYSSERMLARARPRERDSQTLPMTTRSAHCTCHMASVTDNASSGTVERRRKSQEEEEKKITRRRLPNTDIIFELFSILYILLTDCFSGHSNDIPVISLCFFKSPFIGRSFREKAFSAFIVQSIGVIC